MGRLELRTNDTPIRSLRRLPRTRIEGAVASGTCDAGVETVTADGLEAADRRTLHVHQASGGETQVFTIVRMNGLDDHTVVRVRRPTRAHTRCVEQTDAQSEPWR
jgi:hypothetical protein